MEVVNRVGAGADVCLFPTKLLSRNERMKGRKETDEQRKGKADGDEGESGTKCAGVGNDELWHGDAGRSAAHATSSADGQCAGAAARGLVAGPTGKSSRQQSGLSVAREFTGHLRETAASAPGANES